MSKNPITLHLLIPILLLLLLPGCGDTTTNPDNDLTFPEKNISFSQHVQPLFNLRCMNTGCHDDNSRASDLSLTNYFNLTARPGIVIPGNSQTSLLAQKIDGRLPHQFIAPILITQNQVTGIKKWIDEGAKNN